MRKLLNTSKAIRQCNWGQRKNKMKTNKDKIQQFKKKKLVILMGYALTGTLFTTAVLSAVPNDFNIYKQPTQGQSTILLMLDSTANMDDNYDGKPRAALGNTPVGSIYADYPECRGSDLKHVPSYILDIVYGKQATNNVPASLAHSTFPPSPGIPYCGATLTANERLYTFSTINNQQKADLTQKVKNFKYSRMDRMKIAMSMLLSDSSIGSNVSLGLGQFSTATPKSYAVYPNQPGGTWINNGYQSKWTVDNDGKNSHKDGNDISGKILVTNKLLDNDQRFMMRAAVGVMGSGGRTPLASALAESGAYMLGNTTLNGDANRTSPGTSIPRFWYGGWKGIYSGVYLPGVESVGPTSSLYGGNATRGYEYSGFRDSTDTAKTSDGLKYQSPIPSSNSSCNASGIFLLSNGIPTETPKDTAQDLMRNALADQNFSCPSDDTGGLIKATGTTDYGWNCMGAFSKKLFESSNNIKVAVAGFGNNFIPYLTTGMSKESLGANGKLRRYYKCNAITTGVYTYNGESFTVNNSNLQDVKNSCNLGEISIADSDINQGGNVGGYGQGGFYPIVDASQLADSIKNFVADLQTKIPSMNSGIPGIPVDTLNATQQLPYAYYSQFQPSTVSSQAAGIWLGNIKKYKVVDSTFQDKHSKTLIDSTTGNLSSTTDFWSNGADDADATKGGALAKLPVQSELGRKIYTNRASSGSELNTANSNLLLIDSKNTSDTTGTAEVLRASSDIAETKAYLLNLLGFGVTTPTVPDNLIGAPELRQMGATLNSTPLMFTTQSKIAVKKTIINENGMSITYNPGDYINRKDYVLFGTNQGLVQVVNADTGVEKFAFLPAEMITKQKLGFVSKSLQTGSSYQDLYQGVDGAWSVYATYAANNESNSLKADNLNVYGGLRRGGFNYYGLDLKDIDTAQPKILFKVGPAFATNGSKQACGNDSPLNCMGQSWSKPTIARVKWKGKSQLVMIVGGGYDIAFDAPDYKANTATTNGNGIYIFAANSNTETGLTAGDLMWWGSSSATTTTPAATNTTQKTKNDYLKYSVVSEIKSVDRDSDGFIDNLYFGDLGGQIFRVDINNALSTADANFNVKRIVRIGNFIEDTARSTKTAPRFYSMPTFTVHKTGNLKGLSHASRFAVISIGSGDQSSPVLNSLTTTTGVADRIYGIFDRDVGRTDLMTMVDDSSATTGLLTGIATTSTMVDLNRTTVITLADMQLETNKGWFNTLTGSTFGTTTDLDSDLKDGVARYKVLGGFSAISDTLFTSYFDAADTGSTSSCSAGIKGRTYMKNYCLPFGSMDANGANCGANIQGRGFSEASTKGNDVGAGIVPVIVGGMSTSSGTSIGPITGKGTTSGVSATYKTPIRFEPMKWSEKNS